jgi:hypothetical protein
MPSKPPAKPIWEKKRPESVGAPKALSSGAKTSAKRAAEKAGRPYPNMVDNMRAAQKQKAGKLK